MEFRVQGLGIRVEGLGIRFWGSGFRVWSLGFRVQGVGSRVHPEVVHLFVVLVALHRVPAPTLTSPIF